MCRLLAIWANQEKKQSTRYLIKDWLDSWLRSAKYDHQLRKTFNLSKSNCSHSDGWGVVTLGTNQNYEKKWMELIRNLDPIYKYRRSNLIRLILGTPFFNSTTQILLAHVRRASRNMPVTFQQIQPLEIHDNKDSLKLYLAHNGNVDSGVVNELIEKEHQLSPTQLATFSDTQVLSRFIWQRLRNRRNSFRHHSTDFWVQIFKEISNIHRERDIIYQMQLILLEVINETPKLIACSALSHNSLHFMPYYGLFTGQRDNFSSICSSTVVDYFRDNHKSSKWDFQIIPNNCVVNLTNGKFHFQKLYEE